MAARHRKHKAEGGIANAGGNPYVEKEAREKEGETTEKKRGGRAMGKMHGELSRHRLDKPGRKTGGRVGADRSPLSSAHRTAAVQAKPMVQPKMTD